MKQTFFLAAAMAAAGASALAVSDVATTVSEKEGAPVATVFTLDSPAIVTVRYYTNSLADATTFLPVDYADTANVFGAVNRMLAAGTHTNYWRVDKALPGLELAAGRVKCEVRAWPLANPPDYRVFDLVATNAACERYYAHVDALPLGVSNIVYKTDKLVMRRIPCAGITWTAGSPSGIGQHPREDEHSVTLSHDFYLGVYELTQGQFCNILTNDGCCAGMKGRSMDRWRERPIEGGQTYDTMRGSVGEGVNWPTTKYAVKSGCPIDVLRRRTGVEFDLPTDAQWEFACRAGTTGKYPNGTEDATTANISTFAWISTTREGAYPMPVGMLLPNGFGLYDMLGNAFERCLDFIDGTKALPGGTDPKGYTTTAGSPNRSSRGGSWAYGSDYSRSARRAADASNATVNGDYGFRMACPIGTTWPDTW